MTAPETFASLKSILDQGAPSRHEVDGAVGRREGPYWITPGGGAGLSEFGKASA